MKPFLLINTNITRPPVSPIGLEYTGEALQKSGIPIEIIDLAFETDWKEALSKYLSNREPLAVGISVRNIDDSSFLTKNIFIGDFYP
jgi:hypothetical protein